MLDKTTILDYVKDYTEQQLVEYIRQGIVTYEELCNDTNGEFSHTARKKVKDMLENSEEDLWNEARKACSVESLEAYLESYPTGVHRGEARKLMDQCRKERANADGNSVWGDMDQNSIDDLRDFCKRYPENNHCLEARKRISQLEHDKYFPAGIETLKKTIETIPTNKKVLDPNSDIYKTIVNYLKDEKITNSELCDLIRSDNNILHSDVIKQLLDDGYLTTPDFKDMSIDSCFVECLVSKREDQSFQDPGELEKIHMKPATEVYFWGIPSSGKTCALGAILSVAGNGQIARTMVQDNNCQGYDNMNRLAGLFRTDEVCIFPPSTNTSSIYEMGFNLIDQDKAAHPIVFVDLAGELMRCMYKSDAKLQLKEEEVKTLNTLTSILIDNRTENRKIHFFVLEYGAENRLYEGLRQNVYLAGALRYIQRTGIFKDCTDAIYLMITKVDKAEVSGTKLESKLKDYLSRSDYNGFYHGLEDICDEHEINDGRVEIIPFTLGKVCFQRYCLFNDNPASNVVRMLLKRTKGFKKGRLARIIDKFKG